MNLECSCAYCGKANDLLRCAKCRSAYYCCKEHQKQDWKKHKLRCVDISNNSLGNDYTQSPANFAPPLKPNQDQSVSTDIRGNKTKHSSRNKKKSIVNNIARNISPITHESSSENEIISAGYLDPILELFQSATSTPTSSNNESGINNLSSFNDVSLDDFLLNFNENHPQDLKEFSKISLENCEGFPPFHHRNEMVEQDNIIDEVCRNVIRDMDDYGVCVVDNFLGPEEGMAVLTEVTGMYHTGVFQDGQLVSNKAKKDLKTIRGDQITWIDGKESSCHKIGKLISKVDAIIMRANRMPENGKMGNYTINGRTKVSFLKDMSN